MNACKVCFVFFSLRLLMQLFLSVTKQSSYYGYYKGGGACSLDPLTSDYSHKGWIKVAASDGEFQKSLGCGMCVEITGQGILADLTEKGRIPKTPILGPIYAFVIDRCGNCKQGKSNRASITFLH